MVLLNMGHSETTQNDLCTSGQGNPQNSVLTVEVKALARTRMQLDSKLCYFVALDMADRERGAVDRVGSPVNGQIKQA